MPSEPGPVVRVEILVRPDCPNRTMALAVVERAIAAAGVPVELEVVDLEAEAQAKDLRCLGSPSVLVDGLDVEPGATGRRDFTISCRLYRCGTGLQGWPEESWVRSAVLVASAQPASIGPASPGTSSATSP